MSKNYELDLLKSREQEAFRQKQVTYQRYADARDRCSESHDTMQVAWDERVSAKEEMNREWKEMQRASENYREVWDEYGRIRDCNNSRIESLRWEADREHQEMISCFDQASSEYEYGDKSMAPVYSQEGHEHKERRDELNAEISELAREVKEARQNAEWRAPKTDSSAFHRAKDAFERAKARHESAQAEFKRLKAERDRLKAEFNEAQAEYLRRKEDFQRKLEEVKTNRQRERNRTFDKTYDRGAFEEHGHQNFADDGKGFTMYDRRARGAVEIGGSGKENYIDVRTGVGHTTQWYEDGYRVSWDTKDGGQTEKAHWTNQNVSKRHPDRHKAPDDADV